MAGRNRVSRELILETAARMINETGAASMTFQALADCLGVSKQAIIYWFPSKSELARDLIVPALRLEAEAVIDALKRVRSAKSAIEIFLRTLIAFHLSDLGRFRLIYVSVQFDTQAWSLAAEPALTDPVHATTTQMYGALEQVLEHASDFNRRMSARRIAVATHMAGIGLLSMLSLADAVHDPMAHSSESLIEGLISLATGGVLRSRRNVVRLDTEATS